MKKLLLLSAFLAAPALQAGDCKHGKDIDRVLDVSASKSLAVQAGAGELTVRGSGGNELRVRGRACASSEELLEQSTVLTSGGDRAEVRVELPVLSGWSLMGSKYAYIDLELDVPRDLAVRVKDRSGDARFEGLASLDVSDSSGDLDIRDVGGNVILADSSGAIDLADIHGDVTVESDSSGDIEGRRIDGSVLIVKDSSGEIRFDGVGLDFTVERDSSGDIEARGVGGDFTVGRDGSGDIDYSEVAGTVDIPD